LLEAREAGFEEEAVLDRGVGEGDEGNEEGG
jgi:hypothetical protein